MKRPDALTEEMMKVDWVEALSIRIVAMHYADTVHVLNVALDKYTCAIEIELYLPIAEANLIQPLSDQEL